MDNDQKRLNIILDKESLKNLMTIKAARGDRTLTASIKRALAYLAFIEEEQAKGKEVFLADSKVMLAFDQGRIIRRVIMPQ